MKQCLLISFFLQCLLVQLSAQCVTTIAVTGSSPYGESFETSAGGWVSGGVNDDWALGTPNKTEINGAGDGNRCWVTGTLLGNRYNDGEQSWLRSPCFNLTAMQYPYISFKVFWESELDFDGLQLQYSENGGLSWQTAGSNSDPVDCLNKNWYNTSNVDYLQRFTGDGDGWCGNIQTGGPSNCRRGLGSGGWLVAGKTMPQLAGKTNIVFRFVFASGTQCNNFDGAAIDSFTVSEAINPVSFTYQCDDVSRVNFQAAGCADFGLNWNFGDPLSGSSNTSTLTAPTHIFSGPGQYTVTLTAPGGADRPTGNFVSSFTVAIVQVRVLNPLTCPNDTNGTLEAYIEPPAFATGFSFSWNTNPVQNTAVISSLPPGNYKVTATPPPDGCALESEAIISAIPAFLILSDKVNDTCDNNLGFINTTVTGGTGPYLYSWSNGAVGTDEINNLGKGKYTLTVVDDNGCITAYTDSIESVNPLRIALGNDTTLCPGDIIKLSPNGVYDTYRWQDGSTGNEFIVDEEGTYTLMVTDAQYGCEAKDTIQIKEDCGEIYFPTAFSPNGDGRNEWFGALGNLSALENFSMQIYDRWGALVFESTDPFTKWNGKVKTNALPSGATTYVWQARFDYRDQKNVFRKGTIVVIY